MIEPVRNPPPHDEFALVVDFLRAAEDPGLWSVALARVASWLECDQAMILRGEGSKRAVLATNHLGPAAIRALAGRRNDLDATWPICPPQHREFVLPGEVRLSLLVDRVSFDSETLAAVHRLAPIVGAAWRLTDLLAASERRQRWGPRSFETLSMGVLILACDGLVLQANAALHSILGQQRELRIDGGRLRAASPALERSLGALLTAEIRPEEKRVATQSILLPRQGGAGTVEVLVVASPRFSDALPAAVAVALVFDPQDDAENPAVALAARYDLSFEQTQVVGYLLRGRDIPEIAMALEVPQEVITSCLGGIYSQVGTTRQVELVKLLLS